MSRFRNSFAVILGLISIGMVIGVVLTTNFKLDSRSFAEDSAKIYTEAEPKADQERLTVSNYNPNLMFVDVIKKVRPAIVTIYTTKSVKMRTDPFFFFFRDQRMPYDPFHNQEMKERGLGSGVIISKDGYIITNNHVVGDVDELLVKLLDGTEYKAELIGTDPTTEVALIKINAKNLPIAELGNSEKLQIGEWVIAIGNPLELESTVTAGIISALNRDIDIIRSKDNTRGIENFIQTDAAINPGNSGGALVNSQGQVIGINTAIATKTRYYMGYGFAVPINIAKSVVSDLKKYGEVRRGYLGVYIAPVDPVTARGVKLDKPRGVLVNSVITGSAADQVGIEEGDVILSVNGKEVNQPNELQAKIAAYNPGDKVELKIWRDGKEKKFSVTLKGQDTEDTTARKESAKDEQDALTHLGLKIKNLNQHEQDAYEIEHGVLVLAVDQDSPAAKAQIFRGDVIYKLNKKKIKSVDDFYDEIKAIGKGNVVRLKLRNRMGKELRDRLVFMEIPE